MGNEPEVNAIKFICEEVGRGKYRIKLQKDCICSRIIFDNIESNKKIIDFISLINDIYNNNYKIKKKDYIFLTEVLKYVISGSNLENDPQLNLNVIEEFKHYIYNPDKIIEYIKIFELIYNNRNEIEPKKKIYFIESISQLLKNNGILNDFSIKFFINFIYKIYIGEKQINVQILNNTYSSSNSNNNDLNDVQNHNVGNNNLNDVQNHNVGNNNLNDVQNHNVGNNNLNDVQNHNIGNNNSNDFQNANDTDVLVFRNLLNINRINN